jgi:hypothetical protein
LLWQKCVRRFQQGEMTSSVSAKRRYYLSR